MMKHHEHHDHHDHHDHQNHHLDKIYIMYHNIHVYIYIYIYTHTVFPTTNHLPTGTLLYPVAGNRRLFFGKIIESWEVSSESGRCVDLGWLLQGLVRVRNMKGSLKNPQNICQGHDFWETSYNMACWRSALHKTQCSRAL